jgi:hypothetical protein
MLATVDRSVLTTKLELARAKVPDLAALSPPLTAASLRALEVRLGVALPEDYADFLLHLGDGGAGPPAYGLYSLADAVDESRRGIYSFAEPFEPPVTADDHVDLEAPGMLLLGHQGCGYWDGLVVAGPEVGTVWTFVEARPGWIPVCDQSEPLKGADGQPYVFHQDYADWYRAMLLPENRRLRTSFSRYYEQWLDSMVQPPKPPPAQA